MAKIAFVFLICFLVAVTRTSASPTFSFNLQKTFGQQVQAIVPGSSQNAGGIFGIILSKLQFFVSKLAPGTTTTTRRPKAKKVSVNVSVGSSSTTTSSPETTQTTAKSAELKESTTATPSSTTLSSGDNDFEEIKKQLETAMKEAKPTEEVMKEMEAIVEEMKDQGMTEEAGEVMSIMGMEEKGPEVVAKADVTSSQGMNGNGAEVSVASSQGMNENEAEVSVTSSQGMNENGAVVNVVAGVTSSQGAEVSVGIAAGAGVTSPQEDSSSAEVPNAPDQPSPTTDENSSNLSAKINEVFLSNDINTFSERDLTARVTNIEDLTKNSNEVEDPSDNIENLTNAK